MIYRTVFIAASLVCSMAWSSLASANDVEILKVVFKENGNKWDVHVTLKHNDTGWEHYADAWRIVDEDGKELAKRVLYHPHVNEQPFTRNLRGVEISEDDLIVFIEAHDKKHGWSKERVKVHMDSTRGEKFRIITYQ